MVVSNMRSSLIDLTSLQVTLRALVARSEARFLGKPKVLTLNNKPAIMQISSNQAVGRMLNTSGGGTGITASVSAAERVNTGLVLKVIPQVNKEGYITLLIQPSYTDAQISALSTQANPVYDPVTRGISTLVRVRNGQTLVIGGLLQSTETKAIRKVPLLGYIPLIGWFFTSSDTVRKNTDLVIFLTPTIVSD
jgi:type II secretory pathway component GspD/PulD (secretin)